MEALRNLIDNAIKCTDRGSVEIKWDSLDNHGFVAVWDRGIGMTPETQGRLFTKRRVLGQEAHRSRGRAWAFLSPSIS